MACTAYLANPCATGAGARLSARPRSGRSAGRAIAVRCVGTGEVPSLGQRTVSAVAAAFLAGTVALGAPPLAHADLNKFEYSAGGEFGIGSAQQFGEADESDADFHGQVGTPMPVLVGQSVLHPSDRESF